MAGVDVAQLATLLVESGLGDDAIDIASRWASGEVRDSAFCPCPTRRRPPSLLGASQVALAAGRADLIAIGREALFDPNWPAHAAHALGVDADFGAWPQQYGWWLTRRESLLKKLGIR